MTMPYPDQAKNKEEKSNTRPHPGRHGELIFTVANPVWVSVSEAAKLGGIQTKTVRRAIEANQLNFKTKNNRYLIELGSVFKFLATREKLQKKFLDKGLAQYLKL